MFVLPFLSTKQKETKAVEVLRGKTDRNPGIVFAWLCQSDQISNSSGILRKKKRKKESWLKPIYINLPPASFFDRSW